MPPKKKGFIKPKGKAKPKANDPQTENDFLEAADEEEAGAGKWKAGDPAKATRFYNRAIDFYNAGLARYPNSFDLAYNKANLEYKMSEDERIIAILGNKIRLLEETLQSHRFALSLNSENTDVLFNTGQVLASLAEAILEEGSHDEAKIPARKFLEEATDIFTQCLDIQVREYEQIQHDIAQASEAQDDQNTAPSAPPAPTRRESSASSTSSSAQGEWATVLEPLTPETILETCTAQLAALTTLLGLYDPSDLLAQEFRAQTGLSTANTRIPTLITLIPTSPFTKPVDDPAPGPTLSIGSTANAEEPDSLPRDDALLAAANFKSNIAELQYRSHQSTAPQYAAQVSQIFAPLVESPAADTTNDPASKIGIVNALSGHADALIDLASSVHDMLSSSPSPSNEEQHEAVETQWTSLTLAQSILTKLTTPTNPPSLPPLSPSRLADIFLARGDTELFRFRIAAAKPVWAQSRGVLVGNAGVFYRNARAYAGRAGGGEVQRTADAKAVVAEVLKGVFGAGGAEAVVVNPGWKGRAGNVVGVLGQMVEEGVVGREDAEGV
ncbi:hypothetical protein BU24DRAFT_363308, partial [Aaosphaeria arxii CBS 175.79]